MSIKDRIALLKDELKMTTDDLSIKSGVPVGTINKILNGETPNPRLSTSKSIARALGCTLDYLTGESDSLSYAKLENNFILSEEITPYDCSINCTNDERDLVYLWREASIEGKEAAKAVLTAYKKPSQDCAI